MESEPNLLLFTQINRNRFGFPFQFGFQLAVDQWTLYVKKPYYLVFEPCFLLQIGSAIQ